MNVLKSMSYEQAKKLLKAARNTKGRKAARDFTVLFLVLNTGLRLKEVQNLNISDVWNKEELLVRPETTKATRRDPKDIGKKKAMGRIIKLNVRVIAALKEFITSKAQTKESQDEEAPLFVSKKGGRLSRRSLQEMMGYWVAFAGLPDYLTFHSLRHTFAKRYLECSLEPVKALPSLQKSLGHASLASTGVYLEAGLTEMAAGMDQVRW